MNTSDGIDALLREQLPHTLERTDFAAGPKREGKVRDIYDVGDHLVLVTTDRVSAFDHVLGTVPFKGEILTAMAVWGFESTRDILRNHIIATPDPNVIVVEKCQPYPVEFVVRGYVTGSLWRDYQAGRAGVYEVDLPANLERDAELPAPILTPTTKAELGAHDEPTSRRRILQTGAMTEAEFDAAAEAALALYARGRALAAERGLILVDTKYELGLDADGRLTLIDEIHTPDSSRYWVAADYEERRRAGLSPRMLDKENLREWLRSERGFTGHGNPPPLDETIRVVLCRRYMDVYERMVGVPFEPKPGPVGPRIEAALRASGWWRGGGG
jgi:phosphoribosylaminoimidazole-succinocarboxamide synthase